MPASRNIAACVPARLVRIVLATPVTRQAEDGGLVAIDAHGDFGTALFAADARVGDARRRVEQRLDVLRQTLRDVEIVAADLDREAAAVAALVAARHAAHLLAAGRARAHDDAGDAGSSRRSAMRDLFAAALRARPWAPGGR